MKRYALLLFCFLNCSYIIGQQHQIGIKAGLYDYFNNGEVLIGNWFAEAHDYASPGGSINVYYRFNKKYFFIETSLCYWNNQSRIALTNLTPENDYEGNHILNEIMGDSQANFGLNSSVGLHYRANKVNIRGYAGITPSIIFRTYSAEVYNRPWEGIKKSIFNSYEPFILSGNYGIGIDYWRFSFDIKRENNLTPLIKSVDFEGKTYDYRLDTKRLFFMIGFNFYPWKKAD